MGTTPTGRARGTGRDLVCAAGEMNLYLYPDGEVRPCCRSSAPLGFVGPDRVLSDIWGGTRRTELVDSLARGDLSGGCAACGEEVAIEGRAAAYPAVFDAWLDDRPLGPWPRRIEFNLSNRCNLQCVQCNGQLSSAIRIHREKRPAIVNPYGDAFFADLRRFIPHLHRAQFAGGEPFLAREAFRTWELIAELNPELPITIITNATQWNARVERVVRELEVDLVFSLDAVTPQVYEEVRVGASHAEVMANIDRMLAVLGAESRHASVNFCSMVRTIDELGPLLVWAEERGLWVDVSVVREPPIMSIQSLEAPDLRAAHDRLLGQADAITPRLDLNRATWDREVERVGHWADAAAGEGAPVAVAGWQKRREPLIGGLPVRGHGPFSGDTVRAELAALGSPVLEFTTDPHGVILAISDTMLDRLGLDRDRVVGRSVEAVVQRSDEVIGPVTEQELIHEDGDRRDLAIRFGTTPARQSMVAVRGADGTADRLRCLIVLLEPAPA